MIKTDSAKRETYPYPPTTRGRKRNWKTKKTGPHRKGKKLRRKLFRKPRRHYNQKIQISKNSPGLKKSE